jgi:hypothetical protein
MNVMMLSFALYFGFFTDLPPNPYPAFPGPWPSCLQP